EPPAERIRAGGHTGEEVLAVFPSLRAAGPDRDGHAGEWLLGPFDGDLSVDGAGRCLRAKRRQPEPCEERTDHITRESHTRPLSPVGKERKRPAGYGTGGNEEAGSGCSATIAGIQLAGCSSC